MDVSLGNIIVNGKNNYGARMKNIFVVPQTDARYATWSKYYDMVTVTSGTGKKITVMVKKMLVWLLENHCQQ